MVKPSEFSDGANKNLRKSTNFDLRYKLVHFAPYFCQFSFKKIFRIASGELFIPR